MNKVKMIGVRLPLEMHKSLKLLSVEKGVSIQEIIVKMIEEYVNKFV